MNPKPSPPPVSTVGGAAEKQSGTTLAVLAPYVLNGIELEVIYDGGLFPGGYRVRLLGIDTNAEYPILCGEASFMPPGVLPVLYDYRDLLTRLPNGEVPMDSVMKWIGERISAHEELRVSEGGIYAWQGKRYRYILGADWLQRAEMSAKRAEQLRAWGFAVDLESRQYIRKGQANG
ncbi:MAG: hypothetical protein ACRYFX_18610 [Janthinobacterium lividum]